MRLLEGYRESPKLSQTTISVHNASPRHLSRVTQGWVRGQGCMSQSSKTGGSEVSVGPRQDIEKICLQISSIRRRKGIKNSNGCLLSVYYILGTVVYLWLMVVSHSGHQRMFLGGQEEERAPLHFGERTDRTQGPARVSGMSFPPMLTVCVSLDYMHTCLIRVHITFYYFHMYLPLYRVACTKPCVCYFGASLRGFSGVNGSIYDHFTSCLSRE